MLFLKVQIGPRSAVRRPGQGRCGVEFGDGDVGSGGEGVVINAGSGHCTVVCGGREIPCRLRGRLKQGLQTERTLVVAGDRVRIAPVPGDPAIAVVEEVLPRRNRISRTSSKRERGRREQVMMANLDQVVVVQSVRQPDPSGGLVDRLLVAAERYEVEGVLCLNKVDLDPAAAAAPAWEHYRATGYEVLRTSVVTGEGIAAFHDRLQGRISLLLGASGTGKSSLLARATGLELRIGEVTAKTGLGRHTTTQTVLYPLADGGFIADTPGIRGFDPWDVAPIELRGWFPDFMVPAESCRYDTCLHRDETDCGVKRAVARGELPAWRLTAYLGILKDLQEREEVRGPQRRRSP
jgi:ribosome biogenesis GTPase / thiamine phosphate phosphatase